MSTREAVDAQVERLGAVWQRYRRPQPARRAEAAEVARRYRDPRAAWEALSVHGLLPEAWVQSPERWFELPHQFYRRKRAVEALGGGAVATFELGRLGHARAAQVPMAHAWAVALAADFAAVTLAETLAREFAERLRAWQPAASDPPRARTVVWRAARKPRPETPQVHTPTCDVQCFVRTLVALRAWNASRAWRLRGGGGGGGDRALATWLTSELGDPAAWQEAWNDVGIALARSGVAPAIGSVLVPRARSSQVLGSLERGTRARPEIATALFGAELAGGASFDLFEPWLELLGTGYVLLDVTNEAIVLGTEQAA